MPLTLEKIEVHRPQFISSHLFVLYQLCFNTYNQLFYQVLILHKMLTGGITPLLNKEL